MIRSFISPKKKNGGNSKKSNFIVRKRKKTKKLKLENNSWINLLQLGMWDNTCGPRTEISWDGISTVDENIKEFALKITIIGDLCLLIPPKKKQK